MKDKNTVQISATITTDLKNAIQDEAGRDNRSFSQTVELLLNQAIKERERQRAKNKRKPAKQEA